MDVDADFWDVAQDNAALDLTAAIFSPNIKFYASKVNLKLPGSRTEVKYHQDFPFDPHTNMDMMTVLIFLDDVTMENGPLQLVPGSHKGPLHTLWHDGRFTGAVSAEVEAALSFAGLLQACGDVDLERIAHPAGALPPPMRSG